MQKDLKIGLALGMAIAAGAVVWLSTVPAVSTKARMLQVSNNEPITAERRHIPEEPNLPAEKSVAIETKSPEMSGEQQASNVETQDTRFHIIRKGETLSDISYKYYGSANKWRKILTANRQTIKDANRLTPGTKLIIPD